MTIKLDSPEYGEWPFGNEFPDAIEIDGSVFHRAERKQSYDGVVEQYRQELPTQSAHLMVLEDGNWIIDHIDEYNPDMGHPIRHFIVDHPIGQILLYSASGLFAMGVAIAVGRQDKAKQTAIVRKL